MRRIGTRWALALTLLAHLGWADTVDDPRGFSFEPPKGYQKQPDVMPGSRTWGRGALGEPNFRKLTVSGFGGTLPQTPSNHALVEQSAREEAAKYGLTLDGFSYRSVRWKDFDLEVMSQRTRIEGGEFLSMSVAFPFSREAMQVSLMGPASDAVALEAEFDALLGSFDGKVSWKSEDERRGRQLGEWLGALCGLFMVLSFPVIAWLLFRKA